MEHNVERILQRTRAQWFSVAPEPVAGRGQPHGDRRRKVSPTIARHLKLLTECA